MTVDDLKDMIRDILSQEMGDMDGEEDGMEDDMEADLEADDMAGADMTAADDEEINLEELMAELAEMAKEDEVVTEEETTEEEVITENEMEEGDMEEETMEEGLKDFAKRIWNDPNMLGAIITVDGKKISLKDFAEEYLASGAPSDVGPKSSTKTPGSGVAEADLNEALETIQTLQKELNETNLLNAKLLYVNKVFKANSLNESQKANVIAAFDKAETVKEVKLVFETVSENIPSGNKKEVVREARGFASAAVGKSDKPEVITEANEVVLRMQKLAGIIK
jgi:hypothetical protein